MNCKRYFSSEISIFADYFQTRDSMTHLNRFSTNYEPFSTSRNQGNTDIPPRSPHDVTFVRHFNMGVSMIQVIDFVNGSLVVI